MLTIWVLDEDGENGQRLGRRISDDMRQNGMETCVCSFADDEHLFVQLKQSMPDLIFISIALIQQYKADIREQLWEQDFRIPVVMYGDGETRLREAFARNVIGYLDCTCTEQEFTNLIRQWCQKLIEINHDRTEDRAEADIYYIKGANIYSEVVTKQGRYLSNFSLREWEQKLDAALFFRVHRSWILNINYIEKIVNRHIYMKDGTQFGIGRSYRKQYQNLKDIWKQVHMPIKGYE